MNITYSECVCVCVCVTLGIQHAMRMRNIVICGLSGYTVFSRIISWIARLKKKIAEQNLCFDFLYKFCLKHFSF
jgi:hypothetical protein